MASWCIWYDDGATFCSTQGTPEQATVDGVQIVMEYEGEGRRIIHEGQDYYWWLGESWASGSSHGLERALRLRPVRPLVVLFGRWCNRHVYTEIVRQAHAVPCPCGD